jgi:hypothetical protein
MATLRGTQGEPGRTPWGWIFGLLVVLIAAFVITWWARGGAPPADVTGQEGIEALDVPARQPGAPVSPAEQPPPPATPPPQNP